MQLRLWNMKYDHLLTVVLVVVMEGVKRLSDHFFKFLQLTIQHSHLFYAATGKVLLQKRQSLNFSLKLWFLIIYTSILVIFYMNNQVKHS